MLITQVRGLFFQPMYSWARSSSSFAEQWRFYCDSRSLHANMEASSPNSYFGLSPLSFAASLGHVEIFDLLLSTAEQHYTPPAPVSESTTELSNAEESLRAQNTPIGRRRALVNLADKYGNTALHLAVWNDCTIMVDRLLMLGARIDLVNYDGLTPYTLAVRFGSWKSFNLMHQKHVTTVIWNFGNVQKTVEDQKMLDWGEFPLFSSQAEARSYLRVLTKKLKNNFPKMSMVAKLLRQARESGKLQKAGLEHVLYFEGSLERVLQAFQLCSSDLQAQIRSERFSVDFSSIRTNLFSQTLANSTSFENESSTMRGNAADLDTEKRSVVRLVTMFRPTDWYEQIGPLMERVVLKKWFRGYRLVNFGQHVVPYLFVLVLFGCMWWQRELHVLVHNFWWANEDSIDFLRKHDPAAAATAMTNPVTALPRELEVQLHSQVFGTDPVQMGLLPANFDGPETMCGWESLGKSNSGILQVVLVLCGVPCLLWMAGNQLRIRPKDLDVNENLRISVNEIITFMYFNLESLLHIVVSGLLISILAMRVSAGERCNVVRLRDEKNCTSVAALLLFFNLFILCRPNKGLGLLVLTTYKFLISDVFFFLIMYAMLFAGFLIALQTLHNANHVFLAWLDTTPKVLEQIVTLTSGGAYPEHHSLPDGLNRLQNTQMEVSGCGYLRRTIVDTAFVLLEISFGDGLRDGINRARKLDYECAGYHPDELSTFIIIFWMFLSYVLVLNLMVAMMNCTFDAQSMEVKSVWLLDISHRIMVFEDSFPELARIIQDNLHGSDDGEDFRSEDELYETKDGKSDISWHFAISEHFKIFRYEAKLVFFSIPVVCWLTKLIMNFRANRFNNPSVIGTKAAKLLREVSSEFSPEKKIWFSCLSQALPANTLEFLASDAFTKCGLDKGPKSVQKWVQENSADKSDLGLEEDQFVLVLLVSRLYQHINSSDQSRKFSRVIRAR